MSLRHHLQEGEQILYRARPSRVPLVPPLTLAAVGALAGLVGWNQSGGQVWVLALAGVVVAAALIWALARYVELAANQYILTDRRLLRLHGVISQSSMDSYLDKINNVEHHQSVWGRIFGFGDVEVDTAAESGAEVFPRISQPLAWKRAIDAATAAYHSPAARAALAAGAARASGAAAPAGATGGVGGADAAERLRQLKRLADDGLISPAEFEAKRKQLLDQI
ncbi:MAG TPA: PH domain-containing protein [Thermoanaerobaculia bacterium]|nr:PH domain-containing protein [Thermoanaerobaculia bacterium]